MVIGIIASQRYLPANPQNLSMLHYMAKKKDVFTEFTKLSILRWEDYPELSGWMLCHHQNPYKSQPDNSVRIRGHVPVKAEV